ncbi:phage tail protein [Granulicella arctica]|uniref:phage tail protein n=1 Tax=Granulicella arctica TaxID=940613 RepID=UPI0021DF9841|nr:tail fiber protein [Granulicella arctica]
MSTPFLGQISTFGFAFAPKGFALCNGQLLPISQNQALFSLLGTTYGGNGTTTFALPNLQGCASLGFGTAVAANYAQGQVGGEVSHTLISNEIPTHTHTAAATNSGASIASAVNAYPTSDTAAKPFNPSVSDGVFMQSSPNSGGQPHSNQSPLLVINFCIALQGIFPSRN